MPNDKRDLSIVSVDKSQDRHSDYVDFHIKYRLVETGNINSLHIDVFVTINDTSGGWDEWEERAREKASKIIEEDGFNIV